MRAYRGFCSPHVLQLRKKTITKKAIKLLESSTLDQTQSFTELPTTQNKMTATHFSKLKLIIVIIYHC